MTNFKMTPVVHFTIETNCIAIVNKINGTHEFIHYPEAAVWSVLIQNHETGKAARMLQAILEKDEPETNQYICLCLKKWKDQNFIQ
jgi:hypothetical protein